MTVSGSFLLDTNIVIGLFAGEQVVLDKLKTAREIYIPSVVVGELYFGAYKSSQVENNIKRIEAFIASSAVLVCDTVTGFHYGLIKNQLKQKGTPIPDNDIWIAAVAMQYKLKLVSRDEHFLNVPELDIAKW
jgi:tRNA(fMet)-specific endonuclease VapC